MSYPKMKYCGLGEEDRCVVRSAAEEAALLGVWADTPAAFYDEAPAGCRKVPKPDVTARKPIKLMPPATPEEKAAIANLRTCNFCGDTAHTSQACPERKRLEEGLD